MKFILKIFILICLLFFNFTVCFSSTLPSELNDFDIGWNKKVLNIFIENNSTEIKKIFEEWNTKGKTKYNFQFITDKQNADILVLFQDIKSNKLGAITNYYSNDKNLIMVSIILPLNFQDSLTPLDLFVIKHEIGHSLGILKHSDNKKDVMYPTKTEFNSDITKNDIKLLRKSQKKKEQKIQIREEDYDKYKYDLPYLASIYKKAGKYEKAIEIYNEILKSNENFSIAEYSMGYCYFKLKDYNNAEKYLKSAFDKDSQNPVFLNSYIRILCVQNKYNLANEILEKYMIENAENVDNKIVKDCINLIKKYCKINKKI